MSRLPGRAGRMAVAAALVLWTAGASPADAVVLPTPPAPLPLPTTLLSTPAPPPPPAAPALRAPVEVPQAVTTALPSPPDAGAGEAASGDPAAVGSPRPYHPSPDEQASLPNEPQRFAYEQQQRDVSDFNSEMQPELGAVAIEAGGGSGRFAWPVVLAKGRRVPLTQRFGCTDVGGEPYKADCPTKRWHTGIDLGMPMATPVFAADAGVARTFRTATGYGNYVIVVHGNGYATLYGHLSDFAVKDGQIVKKGEQVGFVGSTGFSTGPHLHFEIRYDRDYVDPCAELKC